MQTSTPPPLPRRSDRARNFVIVVVVIVALAFIAVEFRFTTVDVTVINDHTTNTVTFTFMFDGRQTGAGVLGPGQKTLYSVPLSWWFYPCQPHSFSATSTGGESGSTEDSGNLTVCAGTSYATVLSV